MDFLRRLEPSRAAAPGAARLDVAPRWLEAETARMEATSGRPDATGVRSAVRSRAVPAALAPIEHGHIPRRDPGPDLRRVEAVGAPVPGPGTRGADDVARAQVLGPATALPVRPASASPVVSLTSQVGDDRLHPPHAPRALPVEAAPRTRAGPLPAVPTPTRAAPDRPLRADALAERRPRAASDPPIVHVTIDRIDVRLPAADAGPVPRERRPRAPSGVASLSDYLRGGGRG